jgi:S1-C subfamily serine protease
MPAPRFLLKTDLGRFEPLAIGGQPVTAQHARLVSILQARDLARLTSLFAEPVSGAGAISWYGEGTGEPQPLSALSAARRTEAEAQLSAALAALDPLLDDPEAGPLLRRALVIGDADQIVALDDAVAIAGWGLVPRGVAGDEAVAAHARSVLGRFGGRLAGIDGSFLGPVAARPAAAATTSAAMGAPATAVAAPPPPRPPGPPPAPVVAAAPAGRSWWLVPAFAAVALVFLALGVWLAWTHLARDMAGRELSASIVDEERTRLAIRLQRETNEALEREVERARRAAAVPDVCRPEGPAHGLLPIEPRTQPVPPASVPPPVPAQPGQQAQPFQGSLAQLLERATVMIVGAGPEGIGHGTGFFVSGDTVLTNAHVIEKASPDQIFVMSRAIGRAIRASVAAQTRGPGGGHVQPGVPDFAILRLSEPVPGAQPLAVATEVEKLDEVVAAGYPSSVVRIEQGMAELRQGRLGEPPELVLTRGSVSTIQRLPNGLIVMPHSADISPGNSGGPLVDACGRVVGMNTFVSRATEVADRVKYAQKAESVLAFTREANLELAVREDRCQPAAPPVAVVPQAPPAAGPATPPSAEPPPPPPAGR